MYVKPNRLLHIKIACLARYNKVVQVIGHRSQTEKNLKKKYEKSNNTPRNHLLIVVVVMP